MMDFITHLPFDKKISNLLLSLDHSLVTKQLVNNFNLQ